MPWRVLLVLVFCVGHLTSSDQAHAKVFREAEIIGLVSVAKNDLKTILAPYVGKEFDVTAREQLKADFAKISMFTSVSFKLTHQDLLRLYVQERKPVAQTTFQKHWFIDPQGERFSWFGSQAPPIVPTIYGNWQTKSQFQDSSSVFQVAVVLMEDIQSVLQMDPISLHWHTDLGWTVFLQEDLPDFYIGRADYRPKLQRLAKIMPDIMSQKDKILRVDCNFHDRIVVKLLPIEE
ncbi:MAG: cell division protein FtsQ [Deltaproteobacteria bacterium]|nr:cell division protein FtsQ [Deltaproteobacteria bacterium]